MRRFTFVCLALALVVGACSSAAEPQPGDFSGSGADGFGISFTVTDDLLVPEIRVQVACGPITRMETVTFDPPNDVAEGSFDLEFASWSIAGTFAGDGSEVSGSWSSGSCSGSWDGDSG